MSSGPVIEVPIEEPNNENASLIAQKPKSADIQVQIQEGLVHTEDRYICGKRSPHLCGLILTIFVIGILISAIVITVIPEIAIEHHQTVLIVLWGVSGLAMLAYLIEVLTSGTMRYLYRFKVLEDIVSYISRLQSHPPNVWFTCECFHFEIRTRTKQVTYTDSNGYTTTKNETETYTEKVVTYRETEQFKFTSWKDATPNVTAEILKFKVTRIDFTKTLCFGDKHSKAQYDLQYENFIKRNQTRDTNFISAEHFEVRDFRDKMMAIVGGHKKPLLMDWKIYLLFSCFLFAWPYRLWLDRATVKGKFTIFKVVYV